MPSSSLRLLLASALLASASASPAPAQSARSIRGLASRTLSDPALRAGVDELLDAGFFEHLFADFDARAASASVRVRRRVLAAAIEHASTQAPFSPWGPDQDHWYGEPFYLSRSSNAVAGLVWAVPVLRYSSWGFMGGRRWGHSSFVLVDAVTGEIEQLLMPLDDVGHPDLEALGISAEELPPAEPVGGDQHEEHDSVN